MTAELVASSDKTTGQLHASYQALCNTKPCQSPVLFHLDSVSAPYMESPVLQGAKRDRWDKAIV